MKKPPQFMLLLVFVFAFISCVDDVDFEQADEVFIENEVEVDLVYFTLDTSNFVNVNSGEVVETTVREETNLDFLNKDFIQRDLQELTLTLDYKNTFTQSFTNTLRFLNQADQEVYRIEFEVGGSTAGETAVTRYEQQFIGATLDAIRAAIKIEIVANLSNDGQPVEGQLDFMSKAYYRFIF